MSNFTYPEVVEPPVVPPESQGAFKVPDKAPQTAGAKRVGPKQ